MNCEFVVLSGILTTKLPTEKLIVNLGRVITHLSVDMFNGPEKLLYALCCKIFIESSGILGEEILMDMLSRKKVGKSVSEKVVSIFLECREFVYEETNFEYAITQVHEEWEKRQFMSSLVDCMQALTPDGFSEKNKTFKGYGEARFLLDTRLSDLDKKSGAGKIIDIRDPNNSALLESSVVNKKSDLKIYYTGIQELDEYVGGTEKGDFELLIGYTNEGKSMLCSNLMWYRSIVQGYNGVAFVGEMALKQYRYRILCRHSHLPKFGGFPIEYTPATRGLLEGESKKKWVEVVTDFEKNDVYGKIQLCQIPNRGTVDYIRAKLSQFNVLFNVDYVVIDRIGLITANRKRHSIREELGEIVRDIRHLALDFNKGEGVLVTAVAQTNRQSWERAKKQGFYDLNSAAESDEFEKSPDVVVWVLLPDEEGTNVLKVGVAKNRSRKRSKDLQIQEDFKTSYIGTGRVKKKKRVL